jgi:hypothetical protein
MPCDVSAGTYLLINHSTGERFADILVADGSTSGGTNNDTLAELPCDSGEVALSDGTSWSCVSPSQLDSEDKVKVSRIHTLH